MRMDKIMNFNDDDDEAAVCADDGSGMHRLLHFFNCIKSCKLFQLLNCSLTFHLSFILHCCDIRHYDTFYTLSVIIFSVLENEGSALKMRKIDNRVR